MNLGSTLQTLVFQKKKKTLKSFKSHFRTMATSHFCSHFPPNNSKSHRNVEAVTIINDSFSPLLFFFLSTLPSLDWNLGRSGGFGFMWAHLCSRDRLQQLWRKAPTLPDAMCLVQVIARHWEDGNKHLLYLKFASDIARVIFTDDVHHRCQTVRVYCNLGTEKKKKSVSLKK